MVVGTVSVIFTFPNQIFVVGRYLAACESLMAEGITVRALQWCLGAIELSAADYAWGSIIKYILVCVVAAMLSAPPRSSQSSVDLATVLPLVADCLTILAFEERVLVDIDSAVVTWLRVL